jgi:DNA-directed RNA polymerase subunit L
MEIEILKEEKNDVELKVDNLTIAEILRVYLNKQGVEFAAWRREHPSKPAVLKIKTSGKTVKKAVAEAIAEINKDSEKFLAALKKK